MTVWVLRRQGALDTWRQAQVLREGDRVVVWDPFEENELIRCSQAFFDAEVKRGRIRVA